MTKTPLYQAVQKHKAKSFLFDFLGLILLLIGFNLLPIWLTVILFFLWWIFVVIPAMLAIGLIGRAFGKEVNKVAIAQAEAERENLKRESANRFP